jgi:hypothetical protein
LSSQCALQQCFCHGTAADIAHANNEYMPDHYRFFQVVTAFL